MNKAVCATPVPFARLVDYWLGALDAAREDEVERHLLSCGACCSALQRIADLAGGIHALARAGAIDAVVTDGFVKALGAAGARLREYRVPCNGAVHCTVAPADDALIARLQAPLAGVERLDLVTLDTEGRAAQRLREIPFSAAAGEVVLMSRIDRIRALPTTTLRKQLVAVEQGRDRVIGDYRFLHVPWPGH